MMYSPRTHNREPSQALFTLLGAHADDDVLDLLATNHDQHGGRINDLLRGPPVGATFSNWLS